MTIKKISAAAVFSSVSFLLILMPTIISADSLVVNGEVICSDYNSLSWQNGQLTLACNDQVIQPPVVQPPVVQPPPVNPPVVPTPAPTLPPVVNGGCPDPEPNSRIERFNGKGIDREFTLANGSVLVVPFTSGQLGDVRKMALGEPSRGEHFTKTAIISTCPGVYNPDEYDFSTSIDICPVTGLELSYSIISGENRADYPFSRYRCVLLPNTQYYLSVFQRNAGNRPPYTANTVNTCKSNQCGVRVSIR